LQTRFPHLSRILPFFIFLLFRISVSSLCRTSFQSPLGLGHANAPPRLPCTSRPSPYNETLRDLRCSTLSRCLLAAYFLAPPQPVLGILHRSDSRFSYSLFRSPPAKKALGVFLFLYCLLLGAYKFEVPHFPSLGSRYKLSSSSPDGKRSPRRRPPLFLRLFFERVSPFLRLPLIFPIWKRALPPLSISSPPRASHTSSMETPLFYFLVSFASFSRWLPLRLHRWTSAARHVLFQRTAESQNTDNPRRENGLTMAMF